MTSAMFTTKTFLQLWLGTMALLVGTVQGSIQDIDVVIYPSDEFVQYTTAYIRVPGGEIDLRKLHFSSISPSYFDLVSEFGGTDDEYLEDVYNEGSNDDVAGDGGGQDDDTSNSNDDGGNNRRLLLMSKKYDKQVRSLKTNKTVASDVTSTIPPTTASITAKDATTVAPTTGGSISNSLGSTSAKDKTKAKNTKQNGNKNKNKKGKTTTVPGAAATTVPVAAATTVPVAAATTTPVVVATTVPIAAATTVPLAAATTVPVAAATTVPVAAATSVPVAAATTVPLAAATTVPVAAATTAPVAAATTVPVAAATTVPVAAATTVPVAAATAATGAPTAAEPVNKASSLDIVVFPLPSRCSKDLSHCNWADLGVGMKVKSSDELVWCCTEFSIAEGLCQKESFGRLLIDQSKFQGKEVSIPVPYEGCTEDLQAAAVAGNAVDEKDLIITEEKKSATYVVMFSNCNTVYGHDIHVSGELVFLSEHGYLPGELYGFMWFYTIVTVVYILIFMWFYCLMKKYKDYRIDIEKWIFTAISAGCIEMIFRSLDYYIWNGTGFRSSFVIWTGILAGVFKQAFSRCLIVMVSLGWGVIRNSLGSTMNVIIALGIAYVVTLILLDGTLLVAMEQVNSLSSKSETNILNIVALLGAVKITIDVIFIIWIFDALNKTMGYLSTQNNQSHKLHRTRNLRCIIVCAVVIGLAIAVVSWIDSKAVENGGDGYIQEEFAWAKDAATEVNYLFILASIAILWRPNQNARDYAYAMELGTFEDEDDLELSAVDIPSARDDDIHNGYTDEYNTNSRQIT